MIYSKTFRDETVSDEYFGTTVLDPYRWLENDSSEETKAWVNTQNDQTKKYFETIPDKETINEEMTKMWNFERYGNVTCKNGKYYFLKNNGLDNQDILYVSDPDLSYQNVVIDPNSLSEDGSVSISGYSFSHDGNYLAFQISESGSDWKTIRIINLQTYELLNDTLEWVKFSNISWLRNGFFYSRYPTPDTNEMVKESLKHHSLYYHTIYTSQEEDRFINRFEEFPRGLTRCETSQDERYLVVYQSKYSTGDKPMIADVSKVQEISSTIQFKPLIDSFDYEFNFIGNINDTLYFHTDYNAPNFQVISIDGKNPSLGSFDVVIEETDDTLDYSVLSRHCLYYTYIHHAHHRLIKNNMETHERHEYELEDYVNISSLSGSQDQDELFLSITSYLKPSITIKLEDYSDKQETIFETTIPDFDPLDYIIKQFFVTSHDGVKIPIFIMHNKDITFNGNTIAWINAYGGFNISIMPTFSPSKALFLKKGGVYCFANIRGGGEYGRSWHEEGTKLNKKNCFYDLIATAEFLIQKGYATSKKVVIEGGSNGGLLVAATMNMKPDLFGVVIPRVAVLDMLRYHLFTIGHAWAGDYGTSADSQEMFEYLLSYSPLHTITKREYPSVLVTTADHDNRVVPGHSFKYTAALQEAQMGENPILIRVDTKAGHGSGKSVKQIIHENADILSFALHELSRK